MNTARLVTVTALATLGLLAIGSAGGVSGTAQTPPNVSTVIPVDDPGPLGTTPAGPTPSRDPGSTGYPTPSGDPTPPPEQPPPGGAPPPAAPIGYDEAARIAVERAGGGQVTDGEWDFEYGRSIWEIEIRNGGAEHDVLVDADSRAILRHERDPRPDRDDDCG